MLILLLHYECKFNYNNFQFSLIVKGTVKAAFRYTKNFFFQFLALKKRPTKFEIKIKINIPRNLKLEEFRNNKPSV